MVLGIGDLGRNDVAAVVAVYERERRAGTWSHEQAQTAYMLQDKPAELLAALAAAEAALRRAGVPALR